MQDFTEIDLKRLILALFHKAWLLVLCALVAGALAYIYTANFITPLYRASVSIYVNNANPQMVNSSYISGSDLATAQRLVNTYVNIIRSNTVLEKVAQQSGMDITAEQMGGTLVRCLFYLSPEEGLNDAITQAVETVAARRLTEELGYTIDQGQLAEAEEFAQERGGLSGITAAGFLWDSMRGLYESGLHPYILRKYGDKNYLSGMEQELREKAQTLTVVPSAALTSLDLAAIQANIENAPIYWS